MALAGMSLHLSCASRSEYFVVRGASLTALEQHTALASQIVQGREVSGLGDLVLSGHEITGGPGTVLAWRSFTPGIPIATDQGAFTKISIYIPGFSEGPMAVELGETSGVVAFYSSGSSAFPGRSGCVGYARRGSIRLGMSAGGERTVELQLEVDRRSPSGWAEECGGLEIKQRGRAVLRTQESLTPWQGARGQHPYDESYPGLNGVIPFSFDRS